MITKPRKNCIVCLMKIHRSSNPTGLKERRMPQSVTCSTRCSKVYHRVQGYTRSRMYAILKKNGNLKAKNA